MQKPGPRNSITDIDGLRVGHAEDRRLLTGATVILPDRPVVAAADFRGGGTGTRESEALSLEGTVQEIHALAFSGGSAFGLDTPGGVMDWLRAEGRGFEIGPHRVPIAPGAIIFDLSFGPEADWQTPPWWDLGRRAAAAANVDFELGNAGAGLGATAGPLKGGVGTASVVRNGITVASLAVANPVGSVTLPGSRHFWAWGLERQAEFGGLGPPDAMPRDLELPAVPDLRANTTLVAVATDARLTRPELKRVAIMAHDGMAMAIRPVHSPLDGDAVFTLSTGTRTGPETPQDLAILGTLAAEATARAIARAVYEARPLAGAPAWRDLPL